MFLEMVKPSHFEKKNPSTTCFCSIRHRVKQQADLWRQVASELNKKLEAKVEFLRKDSLWNGIYVGLDNPSRMPVANEGLVRDPVLKIVIILVVTGILGRGTTQDIRFGIFMKPLFFFSKNSNWLQRSFGKKQFPHMMASFWKPWLFQTFFIFIPNLGEMIQFDEYFSDGLNQTTN